MVTDQRKNKSISIKAELVLMALVNIAFFYLFARIDLLEWLYIASIEHEEYELDEIIPLFITISISLSIFSFRRVSDLTQVVAVLKSYATHDYLTELFNRRYIIKAINLEMSRYNRTQNVFSVILLDIDDFKSVNDDCGHNAGDTVLFELSQLLLSTVRSSDLVSRWGGEEFLILCPGTDLLGASSIAEAILDSVRVGVTIKGRNITASLGVVSYKGSETMEALIGRADDCLYQSKERGKDSYTSA